MSQELFKATVKPGFYVNLFCTLLFFLFGNSAFSQEKNEITYIMFDLQHSLRIPDNHIIIDITKSNQSISLYLFSFPMKKFEKKYPKTDTTFLLEASEFIKLAQSVSLLNNLDTAKANVFGLDGVNCKIKYGSVTECRSYNIWSPDFDTNRRGLNDYFNTCYTIIKAAHLPFKILL